jgi:hypothetical protein
LKAGDENTTVRDQATVYQRMLDASTMLNTTWMTGDLGPILTHQLAAPLAGDLARTLPEAEKTLAAAGVLPRTFGELFQERAPAVEILRLVKDFAKKLHHTADHTYPEEIATLIYYAAIAAAHVRARTVISDLPALSLRKGYDWALAQPWLASELRPLFEEARKAVDPDTPDAAR